MEYVFGNAPYNGVTRENMKVIDGPDFPVGEYMTVTREFSDCVITDRMKIEEKRCSLKGPDGTRFDIYIISDHYRNIDKTPPLVAQSSDYDAMAVDHEYRLLLLESESAARKEVGQ